MRHHPLTPMTDVNLQRVLQSQLDAPRGRRIGRIGRIDRAVVKQGAAAIQADLVRLRRVGCSLAIADAVDDADLFEMARATRDDPLVVAGSGLAIAIAQSLGMNSHRTPQPPPRPGGWRAVVAGERLRARWRRHCVSAVCGSARRLRPSCPVLCTRSGTTYCAEVGQPRWR